MSSRRSPRTATRRPHRRGAERVTLILVLASVLASVALVSLPAGVAAADDANEVHTGVAYGTEPEQKLDLYLPPADERNGAAVVLVHGGGWAKGKRQSMAPTAERLAGEGFVAATVDYRLVGQTDHAFPDAVHDVQLSVQWLADNAHRYGVDDDKIGMIGSSAGGHLAAMVATLGTTGDPTEKPLATEPSGTQVAAVVSWSGLFDLATLVPGEDEACDNDPECIAVTRANLVTDFLGCTPKECPGRYAEASPIDHVGTSTAPMFLANSTEELIPLSQPDAMINRLTAAGVPNSHQYLPGRAHASLYQNQVWGSTESFLRRHLGVEKPTLADWLVPTITAALLIAVLATVAVRERTRHEQLTGEGSPASAGDRP
ncbi:MAG: alpha/beta hydrolase [Acidimicrobiia bacterium]